MRKSGFLAAVLTVTFTLALVIPASAMPAPKATGSIGMDGPLQYISFNAFDYGDPADDKGKVSYTNFDHSGTATDVWDVRDWDTLRVISGSQTHLHAVTVDEIVPTSPTAYDFTAHGQYAGGAYAWTMTGSVDGDWISFTLYQAGTSYEFWASGTIDSVDGSMAGPATHSANDASLTWMAPAASASEVFHYEADVTCANVGDGWAAFAWTNSVGVDVYAEVTDGGSPGSNDSYAHAGGWSDCDTPPQAVTNYPIFSGNLVVH